MEQQQTAVDWLFERMNMFCLFTDGIPDEWSEALNQAKEMEKEQIIKAATLPREQRRYDALKYNNCGEQYYNETYGPQD